MDKNGIHYVKIDSTINISTALSLDFDCEDFRIFRSTYIAGRKSKKSHRYLLKLVNDTKDDDDFVIFIGNPNLDKIDFHYRINGKSKSLHYEEEVPIYSRLYEHPNCVLPFRLEPQDTLVGLLELSHINLNIYSHIRIYSDKEFSYKDKRISLMYGAYFGFEIFILMLIPMLFYFGTPLKTALSYFIYHFLILSIVVDSSGYLYSYIAPGFNMYEKQITRLISSGIFLMLTNLTKLLLEDKKVYFLDYVRYILFGLIILVLILFRYLPEYLIDLSTYVIIIHVVISILLIIYLLKSNFSKKRLTVTIFAIGISPMIFAGLLRSFLNIVVLENELFLSIANYSLIGSVLFESIVFFGLFWFLSFDKNKKLNESKIKEKELIIANQQALSSERSRISQALHDGINSRIASLKLLITNKTGETNKNKIVNELGAINSDIRSISHALNPHTLKFHGLKGAIEEQIFNIESNNSNIQIKFNYDQSLNILGNDHIEFLYYSTLELLQNIMKHSTATELMISIYLNDAEEVVLDFIDNGEAFEMNEEHFGLGLRNIKTNAKLFQGNYHLTRDQNLNKQQIILGESYISDVDK